MNLCPPSHRWHQLVHQGKLSGGALAGQLAPEKSSVPNQQRWVTPGKQWKCTRKAAAGALVPLQANQPKLPPLLGQSLRSWELTFFRVKVKVQNMRFVKILVFIGCWMKTFWSSLVLGIREWTGQPIPNVKGNLFESKSARTKTFRNTFQWNVRLWELYFWGALNFLWWWVEFPVQNTASHKIRIFG